MNFLFDGLEFNNQEYHRQELLSVKKKIKPHAYVSILQNEGTYDENCKNSDELSEEEYEKTHGIYISDKNVSTVKRLVDLEEKYNIDENVIANIKKLGWKELTFVEEALIPSILDGNSNIVVAATGSGKTGAYLIPAAKLLHTDNDNTNKEHNGVGLEVLIITLNEILQQEVETVANSIVGNDKMNRLLIISASSISKIYNSLLKENTRFYVIIDEFDEVFGRYEIIINNFVQKMIDNNKIISIQCVSATKNAKAIYLAESVTAAAVEIEIGVLKTVTHKFIFSRDEHRAMNLELLLTEIKKPVIIFCNNDSIEYIQQALYKHSVYTIRDCPKKEENSTKNKESSESEHFESENEIIQLFNSGKVDILVATDEVSRGIDFYNTETIINFDPPEECQEYMHRCGRAGRQRYGLVISLFNRKTEKSIYGAVVEMLKEQGQEIIGWNDDFETDEKGAKRKENQKEE